MTAMMTPFPTFVMPDFASTARMREWLPFPVNQMAKSMQLTELARLPQIPPLPQTGSLFSSSPGMQAARPIAAPQNVFAPVYSDKPMVYTDDDLTAALLPIVEQSWQHSLHQPSSNLETHWDPWLRTTIRRAFAEQRALVEPMIEPSFLDHIAWRFQAFFRNDCYEKLVFEKTKRFCIEEVFLLEKKQCKLLSFISNEPSRQSLKKQVLRTIEQIAQSVYDNEGAIRLQFDLPRGRMVEIRQGKKCLLIAVVLGNLNEATRCDLDYTLRRIEDRFGSRLMDEDENLLQDLQPHLEDCLLITAPGKVA